VWSTTAAASPPASRWTTSTSPSARAAEIALTELHAGGKFNQNSYKVSGGLHGVGVTCVNALSKMLRLTVRRDGKQSTCMEFSKGFVQNRIVARQVNGVDVSPMQVLGDTEKRGTEVHFLPDTDIFKENNDFHYEILSQAAARTLRFLNNGVNVSSLQGRAHAARSDDFSGAGGVKGFVDFINKGKHRPAPQQLFHAIGERPAETYGGIAGHATSAWKWPCSGTAATTSRCCASPTTFPQRDGGTHLTGLRAAMTRVIGKYIEEQRAGQEGQGRGHRRRHARRPVLRAEREGARAQVQQARPRTSS
jgi:DNA gyrase subunit B